MLDYNCFIEKIICPDVCTNISRKMTTKELLEQCPYKTEYIINKLKQNYPTVELIGDNYENYIDEIRCLDSKIIMQRIKSISYRIIFIEEDIFPEENYKELWENKINNSEGEIKEVYQKIYDSITLTDVILVIEENKKIIIENNISGDKDVTDKFDNLLMDFMRILSFETGKNIPLDFLFLFQNKSI
mgnify:CR=1 FL=1